MRILHIVLAFGLCGSALSGCMNTAEDKDLEGISLAGGNAIAVNTALQVIDPWPAGVQDTDFPVPADHPGGSTPTGDATSGGAGDATALTQ